MIRPDLPLETAAPHQEHQHQEHSLHPNTPTCSSEETIEEDDCHYEYVHVGVGHSRIARTLLDGHIPTKRPRLLSSSSLETPPHDHSCPRVFVFEVPVVPQASASQVKPTEHGPSLQPGRPSLLTEHCLDDSNSHTYYNNDSSSHSHNNDDGNSSCGWSLQPLAPNTSTPTTPAPLNNAMILTHNNSNNTTSNNNSNGIAMDRWRSHPTISSFSSTITERSTGMDDSSSSYNNNTTTPLFEQQPQQQPESSNASTTTTTTTTSSSSRRKSRHPQKHNSTGNHNVAVEQLTTRLDHCCNITTNTTTSMRALKRRNNIYTPDTQSTLYNPQQDYDYSHAKLARRLRKKNCQQANKEVLRVMTGRLNTNINYNNNNNNCDENTSPMASSSSPSTTTSSSSSNHSTPTMSNTATTTGGFFGSTTPDKHLPTFHNSSNNNNKTNDEDIHTAAPSAMDVIMGESC